MNPKVVSCPVSPSHLPKGRFLHERQTVERWWLSSCCLHSTFGSLGLTLNHPPIITSPHTLRDAVRMTRGEKGWRTERQTKRGQKGERWDTETNRVTIPSPSIPFPPRDACGRWNGMEMGTRHDISHRLTTRGRFPGRYARKSQGSSIIFL